MKATAIAPANIAFIKYWGKKDEKLRLPLNSSISMNLSGALTTTTVEFAAGYHHDTIEVIGEEFSQKEQDRVIAHLDRLRRLAKSTLKARVVTQNNFPKASGIASSASGFAALTVAAAAALDLRLSEKELTILARLGSGSACRSIPDGFVEWVAGETSETSYAYSLYPPSYWDLRDILLIVSQEKKKVSSTAGMEQVKTSPLWQKRIAAVPYRIVKLKQALKDKEFQKLGELIEEDCLDMHAVMQTQTPSLFYWSKETEEIMEKVGQWRERGLPVYFTIDAGPNVHLICGGKDEERVVKAVKSIKAVKKIIINHPAPGAYLTEKHLF